MTADFCWKHPDYVPVIRARAGRIRRMRERPEIVPQLRRYYRDNPAQFINDFGCTSDPRNVEVGLPVTVPFLLFPRQEEWVEWIIERWRKREPGVTAKSRDMGISWLAVALSCTLCCFYDDMAIGFGSRKLDLVDKLGDPKSLFWKARAFMEMLPGEFTGNWRARAHSAEGLIKFPHTGSTIAGEGGDEIGRGARTGIYFVDEAASLQHPDVTDAALSQTTNCQQDLSTPKGLDNPFATKVHEWPKNRVFLFHWRDDPRKDEAWYEKQKEELNSVVLAQEVDMDFAASVTGVLIESAWIQSAIGAAEKLGITVTGSREGALDVADEGIDMNAVGVTYGMELTELEEWSGKGGDIFSTVQRAFLFADAHGLSGLRYDADGLGAGVRGDARVLNEQRSTRGQIAGAAVRPIIVTPFRGSGAVLLPEAQDVKPHLNKDIFKNLKAQSWWTLRRRFIETHRAVEGRQYDPALLLSIRKDLPLLNKLQMELKRPTYSLNNEGKIVIDKAPDGARSPNLADVVMILMGRHRRAMVISDEAMRAA